jgi:Ca2+:H+ antiporter
MLKKDQKGEIKKEIDSSMTWSKKKSFLFLGISMAGVIIVSEILVGSVEVTAKQFGFGELFVGAIIIGIVGNAAEHSSAIVLARKGKIELSIGIAAGSGTQLHYL